ncbi:MAG: hypothetical protein NW220_14620 [Leptolyngbyaceae cyanobacterium bins.349]|nr:hypothetical protein [Leptolyngbyaceae cyanobacterium bins.349]
MMPLIARVSEWLSRGEQFKESDRKDTRLLKPIHNIPVKATTRLQAGVHGIYMTV